MLRKDRGERGMSTPEANEWLTQWTGRHEAAGTEGGGRGQ